MKGIERASKPQSVRYSEFKKVPRKWNIFLQGEDVSLYSFDMGLGV